MSGNKNKFKKILLGISVLSAVLSVVSVSVSLYLNYLNINFSENKNDERAD